MSEQPLQRLSLAKRALVKTGYFTEAEVGDDIAPRITELAAAAEERIAQARREGAADELEMLMDAGMHPASDTWMRDRAAALRGDA